MRRRIHACNTGMSRRTCIHASILVHSGKYMYTQGSQERTDTHADAEREGETREREEREEREHSRIDGQRGREKDRDERERERENDGLFELGGVSLFGLSSLRDGWSA